MPLTVALWSIAALLGTGALSIALARSVAASRVVYGLCCVLCVVLFAAAVIPRSAVALTAALPLGLPWIGAHFRLDVLSAFFLAIINLGGAAASLYAIGYGAHEKHPSRILPFFPAFLAGMNLVLLADDAFSFLVAWEFMSLSSWALVLAHHHDAENRRAAFTYLLMASFGTLALLMAFGLLAGSVGGYSFSDIRQAAAPSWKSGLVLALVLLGAGSKAGLVPLHVWLPLAHPAAPSHVSALMSGVMTKVAIYGFIRIVFDLLGPPEFWWSAPPLTLGAITAIFGILCATIQSDLKKLLAYSTIENIGVIFIALGLALAFKANGMALPAALAFTAALFHIFNHSLFKSLLFFGAGAVLNATGERDIERLGGLIHSMPRTAFLFLGACLAISALPPLNGFVSEWLVFQAVLLSPSLPQWGLKLLVPAVGVALALSAALCAGCFVRLFGIAFLGRARSSAARNAHETDFWSLAAMSGLLALCLLAGLLPSYLIDTITPAAKLFVGGHMPTQGGLPWLSIVPIAESRSSYNGLLLFIFIVFSTLVAARFVHGFGSRASRRGLAWDCGYPDASPVTQYTASSFAQPVRRTLGNVAFVARDHLDMPPPGDIRPARFNVEIHDRVWAGVYAPILRGVDFCADQFNKTHFLTIQGNLTLVFIALVGLLLVVAIWP
ncbi:hydrogenase 4 subunit B [Methylosinus sp. H3A]|uniref:hydrogenase 4 subunit B n=1 Tax=Methylosinus sp. H3A TaxID=2785786 RepID=UPI0018C267BA|nr:hydrogenase 4 subunit B [Methylosinus sp. H3A]MBG0808215.1 hydrogenase 4 subunit B [Methylosinus sp. H3A]